MRYVYFLNKDAANRLTVPVLDFSEIDKAGAGMYKGKRRVKQDIVCDQQTSEGQHLPTRSNNEVNSASS